MVEEKEVVEQKEVVEDEMMIVGKKKKKTERKVEWMGAREERRMH